jgi:hypothetical protein
VFFNLQHIVLKNFINMTKTTVLLALTLIMMSAASVNAQVTIGSMNDPHKGAILDLSQSESSFGVLFPKVYLFNTKEFSLPVDEGIDAKGMMVYNSNASLPDGLGFYAWNGSEWKSMNVGNANSCVPVTATAISEKTGNNAKITVSVTAGNSTFSYVWTKDGSIIWLTVNTNATNDSYTTAGEGIYTVTVTNPCTVAAVSFSFVVNGNGETLIDNGNNTFTNESGQLVYEDKIYTPVKSDVPGIYLDEDGEIVYTGADGIPDTEDDNMFVVPDYPLPRQETLFSIKYPVVINRDGNYQMELDFADGRTYPGTYNGKIKFISNAPNIVAISETGFMTVGSVSDVSTTFAVILEDGSILSSTPSVRPKTFSDNRKLAGLVNAETILAKGSITKTGVGLRATDSSVNAFNTTTLTYVINNGDDPADTGSTITSGGWFHAGDPGIVTVTATATDDESHEFKGTVTVTIIGESPAEEQPYEAISTHWATLDPAPEYAGGDGTEASPYQISSVRQFKKLAADIALSGSAEATYQKHFELTTDLDFSGDNTVTSSVVGAFYGTFDGKGHVIRDLNIDATGKSNVSLFRSLYYGEIKNLGREGGSTTGNDAFYVSGLVSGIGANGKLSNCYNSSSFNVQRVVGGLAYSCSGKGVIIRNCYNAGEIITSGDTNGGLVATCLYDGGNVSIINSYNTGNVSGQEVNGGTVNINSSAENKQLLNLNNVFNFGNITNENNDNKAGSFIGRINTTNSALVEVNATNVYSSTNVVSVDGITKSNQPIGWDTSARETLKNTILAANPTLGENEKYTLDYSQSPAFAAELGDAFKHAPGRTPKLAWEK